MKKMNLFKRKTWAFYLFVFALYTVVYFLVQLLIDKHDILHALISSLVGGVVFIILFWFASQAHEQIADSVKEDEEDRKKPQGV